MIDIEAEAREFDVDPEELRALAALIWDEGYDAGLTDENTGWVIGWDRSITPNPYRNATQPP